mmetsp:Transcript_9537/g.12457  ORF Transcript_9537/g.12457 Transcript_9537/m.12457 type:complete len:680 (-) Transcript_9537:1738-3777(-)|eukprot:CAMPEP_0184021974 /NCGR_PEP_ID=MMETSP0954-20121128/10283_1 /TAXON_ID=627963 /ORGANISM="Aplanochytrium sp, Strain PBS07" /LENGTH=679 /DNA_ID=CAMNT_0026304167 /DNA_START=651 /DNA_END=2690 /DNA_ORIENTATION=-
MGNEESGFHPPTEGGENPNPRSGTGNPPGLQRSHSAYPTVRTSERPRNRRPSFRSRPIKRDINDLAASGRSQSSYDVLSTESMEAPPRGQFMGLKRTKSEIGSDPHSSFGADLNFPVNRFDDAFAPASHNDGMVQCDDIDELAMRLGSRRVSITSADETADEIAKIVSQAAFPSQGPATTNIQQSKQISASSTSREASKSKGKSITSAVKKLLHNKKLSNLSKLQKGKKSSSSRKSSKDDAASKSTAAESKQKFQKKKASVAKGKEGQSSRSEWKDEEDAQLKSLVKRFGTGDWKKIQQKMPGKTTSQIQYRWSKVLRPGLRKGTWTQEEDEKLIQYVSSTPKKNWGEIAALIAGRSAKQCRERWCYNLDPSINKEAWKPDEDRILVEAQSQLGNRWAHIASLLPGRTENAVKTRFKSIMRAKKREWLPEEDDLILKMHEEVGSRWDTIAEKLPNRTKNAVKTRFRQLGKGQIESPTSIGAPNQILRRNPVAVKSNATLAELTQKIAKAHQTLAAIDSGKPIANGEHTLVPGNHRSKAVKNALGVVAGEASGWNDRHYGHATNSSNFSGEQKQHQSLPYPTDTADDFFGMLNGDGLSGAPAFNPKSTNGDPGYYSAYPQDPFAEPQNYGSNSFEQPKPRNEMGMMQLPQGMGNGGGNVGATTDAAMEDSFEDDLLEILG